MGSLKGNLMKAGVVAGSGALLSVLVLGGLDSVEVLGGMWVPKFVAHAVVLGSSSMAASVVVPKLVPYVSAGSPALRRFEALILEPAAIGTIALALESVLASDAAQSGPGGTFKTILVGAAASVGGGYFSEGMGLSDSVI